VRRGACDSATRQYVRHAIDDIRAESSFRVAPAPAGEALKGESVFGILRVESYRKGIFLSSVFNVFAKSLGFGASLAIAYYFGTQTGTGVYFYAVATITMFASLITGLNSSVIIPEAMRLQIRQGLPASMAFLNFFLYAYCAIGVAVTVAIAVDPLQMFLAISQFPAQSLTPHVALLVASIPLFLLMLISTYLTDILTSRKYFTIPMITSMINSGIVLVVAILLHTRYDVLSLLIGMNGAYVLQIAFLIFLLKKSLDWKFAPRRVAIGRHIVRNLLFAEGGSLMSVFASYTPMFLLSGFGAGVIAALSFGQRVADVPTALITLQFSAVAGIKFNELFAGREMDNLNAVFVSSAKLLLFILVPISALVFVFSHEIIEVLYRRGAFDEQAVQSSAQFLQFLILLAPMIALNTLVSRVFMAAQKISIAFWYQLVANATLIAIVVAGVTLFGVTGYLLGLVLSYAISSLMYLFLLRVVFPFLEYRRVLLAFLVLLLLNAALAAPVALAKPALLTLGHLAGPALAGLVYIVALVVVNAFMRLNEEARTFVGKLGLKFAWRRK
jgi:putative peptidoglycan lipid II flippase